MTSYILLLVMSRLCEFWYIYISFTFTISLVRIGLQVTQKVAIWLTPKAICLQLVGVSSGDVILQLRGVVLDWTGSCRNIHSQ